MNIFVRYVILVSIVLEFSMFIDFDIDPFLNKYLEQIIISDVSVSLYLILWLAALSSKIGLLLNASWAKHVFLIVVIAFSLWPLFTQIGHVQGWQESAVFRLSTLLDGFILCAVYLLPHNSKSTSKN